MAENTTKKKKSEKKHTHRFSLAPLPEKKIQLKCVLVRKSKKGKTHPWGPSSETVGGLLCP